MKEREVHSEAVRKRIELKLMEVDVLYEAIKERNEVLEASNTALMDRNNFLEDKINNHRREQGAVYEENCFLKTKMMTLTKSKKKLGFETLDLSASGDLNNFMQEDYQKLQDENHRLADEVDLLRKRIHSMNEDAKNLISQVALCDKNKELRSRGRGSVGPKRSSVGGEEYSKMQNNLDFTTGKSDPENPDLLNIMFSQAIAIELMSRR